MPSSSASVAATPEQLALDEAPFDVATLLGGVSGPVRRESLRGRLVHAIGGEAVDELGAAAALGEADRAQSARYERGVQTGRVAECGRSLSELLVEQFRVPERDRPLGARCGVGCDHGCVDAEQRVGELGRVGDRRGGQQELRLRPVDAGESPQAAQHVADVRAEDAAVHVRLVHDDVAEVREHVAPAVVVREDADMQHVGVREDEVRPAANLPALLAGGVAVVDRGARPRQLERRECPRLILRQRLRGVQVERAQLRVARDRVEHRQVERERLSGGGSGCHDDVLAAPGCVPRLALVDVERVEGQRLADAWVQVVGEAARGAPGARARTRGARSRPPRAGRSSARARRP